MMSWGVSQPGEGSWYAADTSVPFARWRQGEQAVAGLGVIFKDPLGSAQTPHFTNVPDALQMGAHDVLGGFNHLPMMV